MKNDIKRICSLCHEDAAPKAPWDGILPISNRLGHCIGLFCQDCCGSVLSAMLLSPKTYGNTPEKEINDRILDDAVEIKSGLLEVLELKNFDRTQVIGHAGVRLAEAA
jgi:hypothetical protein